MEQPTPETPVVITTAPENLENITKTPTPEKPHIIKRSYHATREFFLGRKSPHENILQYLFRQFLFPDSRGKPSLTATFFIWIMAIVSYLTYHAVTLAFKTNTTTSSQMSTVTMVGFSDSLIYLYITIVGFLGYMFHKRETRECENGATMPAQGGILGTIMDKVKQFTGNKPAQTPPAQPTNKIPEDQP